MLKTVSILIYMKSFKIIVKNLRVIFEKRPKEDK